MIYRSASVCRGRPRVRDTRIPVWLVVGLRNRGASDAGILAHCPALTQDDLNAVWAFYEIHKDEVDCDVWNHSRLVRHLGLGPIAIGVPTRLG